jgi:predicted nucleic acid-binding protein
MVLVDTNILVDVWESDPEWSDWSVSQLRAQAQIHPLFINPVIYAELSVAFKSVESLDQAVEDLGIQVAALPRAALFLAGKAFVQYRRRGGRRTNVLSDFFIGAHAAVERCQILTRDIRRYETYFPSVKLIVPKPGNR